MVDLQDLGWDAEWQQAFEPFAAEGLEPARVAIEFNYIYRVYGESGERQAGVTETVFYNYIAGNVLSNVFRAQNGTTQLNLIGGESVRINNIPRVTVWPTPDNSQPYQFVYWRLRRTQDAGSGTNVMDVPFRFIPCMAAGLARLTSRSQWASTRTTPRTTTGIGGPLSGSSRRAMTPAPLPALPAGRPRRRSYAAPWGSGF